jgi:hypothetical protein
VHARYAFDFIKVEWDVATGRLKPIGLRFEFDRAAMFRILSDDIYEGDPYIFLRELLQNAIDAVRTRQARLAQLDRPGAKKKTSDARFDTTIYFSAEHQPNGDILVNCRDNGIGMDEHVIRNYFSVAGISYYRSPEFERQHLSFEPVSRFGVGILSCFMVAESLELRTYRDPLCGPPMAYADSQLPGTEQHQARRLQVRIPAVDRQFVVTDAPELLPIGTEFELTISAKKLKESPHIARRLKTSSTGTPAEEGFQRVLRITEFLSDIAGFVEFPIHVSETWPGRNEPLLTLILHPDRNGAVAAQDYNGAVTVRQLSRDYPWAAVTDPESLAAARDQMTAEHFELSSLVPGAGYEGWLTFPAPKSKDWDFADNDRNPQMISAGPKFHRYHRATFAPVGGPISWTSPQQYAELRGTPAAKLFGVYRDGIRLPALNKVAFTQSEQVLPLPAMYVNLPSETAPPNLARTSLGADSENWDKPILEALVSELAKTHVSDALRLNPAERLFRLGWIGTVFRTAAAKLITIVPETKTPTLWLVPTGGLEVREDGLQPGTDVCIAPDETMYVLQVALVKQFSCTNLVLPAVQWEGPPSLMWQSKDQRSKPVLNGFHIGSHWATTYLTPRHLQFLQPPTAVAEVLRQTVCASIEPTVPNDVAREVERGTDARRALVMHPLVCQALEVARDAPVQLTIQQRDLLHRMFPFLTTRNPSVLPIVFADPFSRCAGTRQGDLNLLHGFGQNFCRALGVLGLAEIEQRFTTRELERLHLNCRKHAVVGTEILLTFDIATFSTRLFKVINDYKFLPGFQPPAFPNLDEFVPTFGRATDARAVSFGGHYLPTFALGRFGAVITAWP